MNVIRRKCRHNSCKNLAAWLISALSRNLDRSEENGKKIDVPLSSLEQVARSIEYKATCLLSDIWASHSVQR